MKGDLSGSKSVVVKDSAKGMTYGSSPAVRLEIAVNENFVRPTLDALFRALKDVVDPRDIRDTIREKLEVHAGTVNDVLQSDDPKPVLGFLYPLALMLKHGKLSVGILTSEQEIEEERPRRRFRDLLRRPRWSTILVAFLLYGVCLFLVSGSVTAANVLVAGEGLRFDVTNAVSPETDVYTVCVSYTVNRQ